MTLSQYIENISNNFKLGKTTHRNTLVENSLIINSKITDQISEKLKLAFINAEQIKRSGEVCFAASPEVRPEFRSTFTSIDTLDYVYAVLYSSAYYKNFDNYLKNDLEGIPIPTDTAIFWDIVILGNELIKIHSLENSLMDISLAISESEKIIKKIDKILLERDHNF